jgi:DeoR family glycerol-3-phosphate regulon repressor
MSSGEGRPKVLLLGGEFRNDNAETVGPTTIEQIRGFQADHAVITVAALDASVGAMDAELDEAHVARAMIECAHRLIVVADARKMERKAAFRVCRLDEIDVLVSDTAPSPAFRAALGEADVEFR